MQDHAISVARDWLTLALTGLGISFLPHEYLGGMFLSLAGASLASHWDKTENRKAFWVSMLTAFFVSHVAAMAAAIWLPALLPQLVMAATGLASSRLMSFAMKLFGVIESRSDKIADKLADRILQDDEASK